MSEQTRCIHGVEMDADGAHFDGCAKCAGADFGASDTPTPPQAEKPSERRGACMCCGSTACQFEAIAALGSDRDAWKARAEKAEAWGRQAKELLESRDRMLDRRLELLAASQAREAKLREALVELVALKDHKDRHGKDAHYEARHPAAWEAARAALSDAPAAAAPTEEKHVDEIIRDDLLKMQNPLTRRERGPEPTFRAPLYCPRCQTPHVDEGDWAKRPHHEHLCSGCGETWRVEPYTFGVEASETIKTLSGMVLDLKRAPRPAMHLPAQMGELRNWIEAAKASAVALLLEGVSGRGVEPVLLALNRALRLAPVQHDDQQGGKAVRS